MTISPESPAECWAHAAGENDWGNGVRPEAFASHEGAEAGDRLADDQGLHLIGAFVGIERLGIRGFEGLSAVAVAMWSSIVFILLRWGSI
jgi:hypothetical protein